MLIEVGEKIHLIYRAIYDDSIRRHFAGEVIAVENDCCRLHGYVFVFDVRQDEFVRKPEKRTTFVNLGDAGYIVNLIPKDVKLDDIHYSYHKEYGLVARDNGSFRLDISEFTAKS